MYEPSTWRPSGETVDLPADTNNIAQRLATLARLPWPSPACSLELAAIAIWPMASTPGRLTDTEVVELMFERLFISPVATEKLRQPAYDAAEVAWGNLQRLAMGDELPAPGTTLAYRMDDLAKDWLWGVVSTLQILDRQDVVRDHEMAHCLRAFSGLDNRLHAIYARTMFDHPLSIGYSLYVEPAPGKSRFDESRSVQIAMALALAADVVMDTYEQNKLPSNADAVGFFWWLLKGYVYAGTYDKVGFRLPTALAAAPSQWAFIKQVLLRGFPMSKEALTGISKEWAGTSPTTTAIAVTPVNDLISDMDRLLMMALTGK